MCLSTEVTQPLESLFLYVLALLCPFILSLESRWWKRAREAIVGKNNIRVRGKCPGFGNCLWGPTGWLNRKQLLPCKLADPSLIPSMPCSYHIHAQLIKSKQKLFLSLFEWLYSSYFFSGQLSLQWGGRSQTYPLFLDGREGERLEPAAHNLRSK